MIHKPKLLGTKELTREELAADKDTARKIGPCAVGRKALYLNSFYFSRWYYVCWEDVQRVFKRVAMSKGGYTGKGLFGSIPYLVVQFKNGGEKQCNFKFEDQVDQMLDAIGEQHPGIPLHSVKAQAKLDAARRAQEAKYLKDLSPEAERSLETLQKAQDKLEERTIFYRQLSYAAKQKRIQDHISPSYRVTAIALMIAAIALVIFGAAAMISHRGTFALASLLGGLAIIAVIMATQVLPTGTRNKKAAQNDWDQALKEMQKYISDADFPVPAQYAHPVVLRRMIRIIREGRAVTTDEALEVLKSDLKALNSSVKVSQEEYDEVTAIKPMFLVCGYK